MRMMFCMAALCFALGMPGLAQNADTDPASKDDVILYLRTMHSHDMMQRMMQVESQSIQTLLHDQILKDTGSLPANYDLHMKKAIDGLIKGMPADEIIEAMIPAYQNHFTHGDIQAMNAFYSSAVGQKVLEELPAVTQDGMQAAMPILNKYLTEWKQGLQDDLKEMEKGTAKPASVSEAKP